MDIYIIINITTFTTYCSL